ncbi:MAG: hypothetical protein WD875_15695 [Pirellulales bacterium]
MGDSRSTDRVGHRPVGDTITLLSRPFRREVFDLHPSLTYTTLDTFVSRQGLRPRSRRCRNNAVAAAVARRNRELPAANLPLDAAS